MQQLSISSKWSNKALPLQGRYLAATWAAYVILKIGFCEIMLMFVHTFKSCTHCDDYSNLCINIYHIYLFLSLDICILPGMQPEYIVLR